MSETAPEPSDTPGKQQHGDPLLDSAQDRNDGDDGSRHGVPPEDTAG